jgi:hypothetical protein
MDVPARDVQFVDQVGDERVLRIGRWQDDHVAPAAFVQGPLDPRDDVRREGELERRLVLDDADVEVRPRMIADLRPGDAADALADALVAERQEPGQTVLEIHGHGLLLCLDGPHPLGLRSDAWCSTSRRATLDSRAPLCKSTVPLAPPGEKRPGAARACTAAASDAMFRPAHPGSDPPIEG